LDRAGSDGSYKAALNLEKKSVLMFSAGGTNDAVPGQMNEYGNVLADAGISIIHITPDPAEIQIACDLLLKGKVGFAITWLGYFQSLAVTIGTSSEQRNVWEMSGVPLLKIHGDMPAYYAHFHGDIPATGVNLYAAAEYMYFRRRWLRDSRAMTGLIPSLPLAPIRRTDVDVAARRRGQLVFLKNGNSPDELRQLWVERLPRSVAGLLADMSDELAAIGTKPGVLHIGDFVAERLEAEDIAPDSATYLVRFMTAQLDDYLRRVKSRMIAESILDLPVIVQGSSWHHVDFAGRRATLVGGQEYDVTNRIYAEQLGIIDMSPNVDSAPHERVQRAAGSFATVLTNQQSWLSADFPGFDDLSFDFTPESIKDRVADVLAHPERYIELGIAFGERFRARWPRETFAEKIIMYGELAALQWDAQKPPLQPFFDWGDPQSH
jgi:hypothetical protein